MTTSLLWATSSVVDQKQHPLYGFGVHRRPFATFATKWEALKIVPSPSPFRSGTHVRPEKRIHDFCVLTRPCITGKYDGAWEVHVVVDGEVDNYWLYDLDNRRVAGPFAANTFTVTDVKPWSPESPTCYKLILEGPEEVASTLVAFHVSGVQDGRFISNGRVVTLKAADGVAAGVSSDACRTPHEQRMAIRQLKALHGTALQADVWPNDLNWQYLCLTHGLHLLDKKTWSALKKGKGFLLDSLAGRRPEEVRYHYQNWAVKTTNHLQRIVVQNRNYWTDATGVSLNWTVLRNGEEFSDGTYNLRGLDPRQEMVFDLPPDVVRAWEGNDTVSVRFEFVQDETDELFATDQLDLFDAREVSMLVPEKRPTLLGMTIPFTGVEPIKSQKTEGTWTFETENLKIVFSKTNGLPCSVQRPGTLWGWTELLCKPFEFDAWVGEQSVGPFFAEMKALSPINDYSGVLSFTTLVEWTNHPENVAHAFSFLVKTHWTILPSGVVSCESSVMPRDGTDGFSRVGFVCGLTDVDPDITWFGLGPWAHTAAQKAGAFLGRWELERDAFVASDATSVASGNREDVRGVSVGDLTVRTLGAPFAFTLTPSTSESTNLSFGLWRNHGTNLSFTISQDDPDLTPRTSHPEASHL